MRKKVLITGPTSGIGKAFAQLFAEQKDDLILVARNAQKLDTLKNELQSQYPNIDIQCITADLAHPEIIPELIDQAGDFDILINNAGVGLTGPFLETDLKKEEDMIALNITSLTALTKYAVQMMKKKGHGNILNVASTAAFQPGPGMAVYFATKAYVLHLTEALSYELRDTGITLTALCPGPTKTEFEEKAGDNNLFQGHVMSPERVAKAGFDGLMAGKEIVLIGFNNRFLTFLNRITPRKIVTKIVGRLMGIV